MSGVCLDLIAQKVLSHYPVTSPQRMFEPLGNHGGFSGAQLWRVEGSGGPFCLRAWPPGEPSSQQLHFLHRLMIGARRAGLDFVPTVFRTRGGDTWVEHAGRLWELTAWLPGRADYQDRPTPARLQAACVALARLHGVWAKAASIIGPCPGVRRRLERLREWQQLIVSGWRPVIPRGDLDPVQGWAERAWRLLGTWTERVPKTLAPWVDRPVPLQPCLCDIWHDHVLYEGDAVTGLIDYGGVKVDHVAIDLARLLGSLAGDDPEQRATGLRACASVQPLSAEEEALITALDETGTILGAANWLKWLYRENKSFEDREEVAWRLAALVERMERWK